MKKTLLAVAVLGAFAGAVSAQSSVTLFGVVDLSANVVKNGGTTTKTMESNQLNSNRLGFKGTEDLGGGLIAGFWLEAGMSNDTGAVGGSNGISSVMFNRRSTVSLISKLGEIRLGRDYNPTFWNTAFFDVYGANGLGQFDNLAGAINSGAATFVRSNNAVSYFLPGGLGGIYGQAQVAAGEGTVGQKYTGGRLGYAVGPFDAAVAYAVTKTAGVADFKIANVGGSWDFTMAKLFALYNQSEFGGTKVKTYGLSGSVPLGQGQVKAGFTSAKATGAATAGFRTGDDAKQYSVQYIYNLSKRTALYTGYSKIKNDGNAAYKVGGTNGAGLDSQGYNLGVRHSF
jgi:predicted porin